MEKIRVTCVVLGFVVAACPVLADGNDLLKKCSPVVSTVLDGEGTPGDFNAEKAGDAGFCLGFAQGFTQAHWSIQAVTGKGRFFCLPKAGVKNGQAVRIFVSYMRAHPEKLHLDEIALATFAFQEAFPCEETSKK